MLLVLSSRWQEAVMPMPDLYSKDSVSQVFWKLPRSVSWFGHLDAETRVVKAIRRRWRGCIFVVLRTYRKPDCKRFVEICQ